MGGILHVYVQTYMLCVPADHTYTHPYICMRETSIKYLMKTYIIYKWRHMYHVYLCITHIYPKTYDILELRLSPEIPSQIDWHLKIQNTTFLCSKFPPQIWSPLQWTRAYHTYIHLYIHTPIHTYTYTYTHLYIHTPIHTYTYTYIHPYIRTPIHTYTYTYIHLYICIPEISITFAEAAQDICGHNAFDQPMYRRLPCDYYGLALVSRID